MIFSSVAMHISGPGFAFAACIVADPTGTPLHVRESPRGKKTSTLINGTVVEIQKTTPDDRGLPWARIRQGWVYANFLNCSSSGASSPGSPARSQEQLGIVTLKCSNISYHANNGGERSSEYSKMDQFYRIDLRRNTYEEPGKPIEKLARVTSSKFVLMDKTEGCDFCNLFEISRIDGDLTLIYSHGNFTMIKTGHCEKVPEGQFPRQKF